MSTTQIITHLLDADGRPVVGARVTCTLGGVTDPGWLADHTAEIIDSAFAVSDAAGLITFTLTPQTALAASGTYYAITGRGINWAVVVPVSSGPVQIRDCLVDSTTLTPVPAVLPSYYLQRTELGTADGVASLGSDGLVPAGQLPASSTAAPMQSLLDEIVARQIADEELQADIGVRYAWDPGLGIPEGDLSDSVQAKLNASAGVGPFPESAVTNLVSDLAGKAATAHSHAESDVTSLTTDLAGKLAASSNLSDVGSTTSARTNLGLGGAAVLAVGTTTGTVAAGDDSRLSDTRTPTDGTVTDAKVSSGAAINVDKTADGTTNKVYSVTDKTKLAGIASGATANSPDATLLARGNHTGTESADVLTDGTTNKAFLSTERTKLAGIATGATANSSDAVLEARANHTGTQSADTLTDGTTNKAFLASERTKLAGIGTGAAVTAVAAADSTITIAGTSAAPTVAVGSIAESKVTNLVSDLAGKAASSHSHAESDVTSLAADLAAKVVSVGAGDGTISIGGTATAPTVKLGTVPESAVTNLTTDLAGKAAAVHTHAESDVTSLAADLAGKAARFTPTAVKTSAYTAAAGELVLCDASAGSFTVTLPAAPVDKTQIIVKNAVAPGVNAVTVALGTGDHFSTSSGATSVTLALTGQTLLMQYQASTALWFVLANDLSLTQLDGRYVLDSLLTAKGDVVAASAASTPSRVAVGSDGQILTADSTQTAGVKWAPAAVTSVNTRTGAVTGLAEDSAVAHNTGAETWAGVKTFSIAPVVPSSAFPESAITNLATDLAAKLAKPTTPAATSLVTIDSSGVVSTRTLPDVQVFTSSSTWTKPAGATVATVFAIGGGGGGGSGARRASGTASSGGAGGGGGGWATCTFRAADLGSTETVTIGVGGGGGAAVTANDSNGVSGSVAGSTIFGTTARLRATGGNGGAGGSLGTSTGGAPGVGTATGVTAGGTAVGGAGGTVATAGQTGASGSGGGGVTAVPAATAGALGGHQAQLGSGIGGGTAGTAEGGAGGAGVSGLANNAVGGGSGGGGGSAIATTGGAGGAGGSYGGAGSGGGSSINGNNSGAGGTGASGIVVVISW